MGVVMMVIMVVMRVLRDEAQTGQRAVLMRLHPASHA